MFVLIAAMRKKFENHHYYIPCSKKLGELQSERLEASADLESGEDPKDAALKLRQWVNIILDAHPKLMEESTGKKQSEDREDVF